MKINGIIVEYNPMHNGHLYHLEKAKENADLLIAVMGGNYTMRGEVAPYDKFLKTELALKYGIDLIIELPTAYTIQNADVFAKASIDILKQLEITDLYFGSESNDLVYLKKLANLECDEKINNDIKSFLSLGNSYPKSYCLALEKSSITPPKSGDMLNISYLKALKDSNIICHPIKRNNNFSSASSIREKGPNNDTPIEVFNHFNKYGFNNNDNYTDLLKYRILNNIIKDEGLENALNKPFSSFSELSDSLTSKRYTKSRINRFLLKNLLQLDFNLPETPPYLRVLGMNEKGKNYLNLIKKRLTIITNVKEGLNPLLDFEIKCSAIYSIKYHQNIHKLEFQKPIIL